NAGRDGSRNGGAGIAGARGALSQAAVQRRTCRGLRKAAEESQRLRVCKDVCELLSRSHQPCRAVCFRRDPRLLPVRLRGEHGNALGAQREGGGRAQGRTLHRIFGEGRFTDKPLEVVGPQTGPMDGRPTPVERRRRADRDRVLTSAFRRYPLRCLKNSTCRRRFSASALLLYGPPRFFPFSDSTL